MANPVKVYRSDLLQGLPHGFLGRKGGVSVGEVAGLNVGLGSDDDPAAVARNRALAAEAILPGAGLVTVYQVHSADCVVAPPIPWPDADRPHADALVSNTRGVVLGILTADCAPVLFADREAGVVGAAHAGWKGAIGGVTDSTIEAMEALGAKRDRIVVVVGPCIAQDSYEVDCGFRDRFIGEDEANAAFFLEGRADHFQFDLQGYVLKRLRDARILSCAGLSLDTYALKDGFYSFRRATHQSRPNYGRQMSLIGLGG